MKKLFTAAGALAATMALATAGSAGASPVAPTEQAVGSGDAALSTTPVAEKTVGYRGTLVPAGGVELSVGKIAYDGGATILTVPEADGAVGTRAYSDCAAGYVCLWADAGYGGRRLQLSSSGCHNLGNYGFNDQTSSWRNRLNRYARLRWDANCDGNFITLSSGAASSNMGSNWNDEASSLGIS